MLWFVYARSSCQNTACYTYNLDLSFFTILPCWWIDPEPERWHVALLLLWRSVFWVHSCVRRNVLFLFVFIMYTLSCQLCPTSMWHIYQFCVFPKTNFVCFTNWSQSATIVLCDVVNHVCLHRANELAYYLWTCTRISTLRANVGP